MDKSKTIGALLALVMLAGCAHTQNSPSRKTASEDNAEVIAAFKTLPEFTQFKTAAKCDPNVTVLHLSQDNGNRGGLGMYLGQATCGMSMTDTRFYTLMT